MVSWHHGEAKQISQPGKIVWTAWGVLDLGKQVFTMDLQCTKSMKEGVQGVHTKISSDLKAYCPGKAAWGSFNCSSLRLSYLKSQRLELSTESQGRIGHGSWGMLTYIELYWRGWKIKMAQSTFCLAQSIDKSLSVQKHALCSQSEYPPSSLHKIMHRNQVLTLTAELIKAWIQAVIHLDSPLAWLRTNTSWTQRSFSGTRAQPDWDIRVDKNPKPYAWPARRLKTSR